MLKKYIISEFFFRILSRYFSKYEKVDILLNEHIFIRQE